jgi:hypothetical protein
MEHHRAPSRRPLARGVRALSCPRWIWLDLSGKRSRQLAKAYTLSGLLGAASRVET